MGTPAENLAWMDDANCRGLDTEEFFPPPFGRVTLATRRVCGACTVRSECLQYAIRNHEKGYWGGIEEKNRNRLQRYRVRRTCPNCRSAALILRGLGQSCTACGLSWFTVKVQTLENGEAA